MHFQFLSRLTSSKAAPKGFVILFTILIAAIIMVIGLGIYSIASREAVLSGTSREAQYAFYAADAGVECALYVQKLDHDAGVSTFGTSGSPMSCGYLMSTISGAGTATNPFMFNVLVDEERKTCARVNMYEVVLVSGTTARRVISQGYNMCDVATAAPLITNPILVERDLDTLYVP